MKREKNILKKSEDTEIKGLNNLARILYVGDDTGLLKKLNMTIHIQEDIISMPSQRRPKNKRKRNPETDLKGVVIIEDEESEEEKDIHYMEEQPVIRTRPIASLKQIGKSGA